MWDNRIVKKKTPIAARLLRFLFLVLVFSIPFNTKKFIVSFFGAPSEGHSAFLFGLDIGVLLVLFVAWRFGLFKKAFSVLKKMRGALAALLGFLVFALVSLAFAPLTSLACYTLLHLALAVAFFFLVAVSISSGFVSFKAFMTALAASAVFQAIIAFFQFLYQGSVGLSFLGESIIDRTTTGVARIFVDGAHLLRVYGTMPHANILAGFLAMGLLALIYLWMEHTEEKTPAFTGAFYRHLVIAVASFAVLLALVLTFSRSGWIVGVVGAGGLLLMGFFKKEKRKKTGHIAVVLSLTVIFLGYLMWFAIFPRVERLTMDDPSVQYRVLYNELGSKLVLHHPFGVGIGSQPLTSIDEGLYTKLGITRAVDWQPIHNLYLLVATEVGIPGAVLFVAFLAFLFFGALDLLGGEGRSSFSREGELELRVAAMMLFALLVFGLFDHFLWTLESGRMMLWFALGALLGIEVSAPTRLKNRERRV